MHLCDRHRNHRSNHVTSQPCDRHRSLRRRSPNRDSKPRVTVTPNRVTKPWLSANMLPTINTCEKRWSNVSENQRVLATKLLELTQFASPNRSIYLNFVPFWGRCDRMRFFVQSTFIEKSITRHFIRENL